jgi:hypothetical protein
VVSGWLLKIVFGIALAGLVLFELGSPAWTRAQLDSTAHDIADEAAFEVKRTNSTESARAAADQLASKRDVRLTEFRIDAGQRVHVTVYRQAKSYVLRRFDQTKDWYDVSVSADAVPPQS